MGIFFKEEKGVNPILSLLVIVILLGIVFFIRVNLSINKDEPVTAAKGNVATTTTHDAEIFNLKFKTYQGANVGNLAKTLVLNVKNSNSNSEHKISITFDGNEYKDEAIADLANKIELKTSYIVKLTSFSEDGYVETISIDTVK